MIKDRYKVVINGHIAMFCVDPERDLLRFCCRFCGAVTEPMPAWNAVPEEFGGLAHEPGCYAVKVRGAYAPE